MRRIAVFSILMGFLWGYGCEVGPMAPEFEPISERFIAENDTLRIIVHATDEDGDTLTYHAEFLPPGAEFDTETQLLSWIPTGEQGGSTYRAVILVSDGEHVTEIVIRITVIDVPTYDELMLLGWQYFSFNEYQSAAATFLDAVNLNETSDALTALGWAYLLSDSIRSGEERFTQALALEPSLNDARAGRTVARRSLQEYEGAIEDAREVLNSSPDYVFSRNNIYDYRDILIIIAQSAFAIADYPIALEAVNTLDPSTSISPDDSNTWIVADVQYNTYQEALLILIEKMEELYGS